MTSVEYSAHSPRISDADRERALDVLRDGMAEGRVSHDTFVRRMERILAAGRMEELHDVLRDLPYRQPALPPPPPFPPSAAAPRKGWVVDALVRMSTFNQRLRRAWHVQRLPQLVLPAPGPVPLSIGRSTGCGLRLNHTSVSRHHALLLGTLTGWTLSDLGSANGTWVNGRRVIDAVPVRPGDHVSFGAMSFRLAERLES